MGNKQTKTTEKNTDEDTSQAGAPGAGTEGDSETNTAGSETKGAGSETNKGDSETQDTNKKKAKKVPGLRITSARDGFRRAGRAFGKEPTDIPLAELTKEQRAALHAEPMLTVEKIEIEVEA